MTKKKSFNTIVLKVGSSSLTSPQGKLELKKLNKIATQIAELVKAKKQVLLVTSGAIACGAEHLGLGKPKTIPQKQAAAAVGQSRLMRQYEKALEKHGITVAQILLTKNTITQPELALNAKRTISTLFKEKVVPIVNENDTVAIDEIKIGDNDNLAALTARLINADLLVLLTDVDGFYLKNKAGKSVVVPEIKQITLSIEAAAGSTATQHGTGGMKTKLQAAKICKKASIHMAIINSHKAGLIKQLIAGKSVGTVFLP